MTIGQWKSTNPMKYPGTLRVRGVLNYVEALFILKLTKLSKMVLFS